MFVQHCRVIVLFSLKYILDCMTFIQKFVKEQLSSEAQASVMSKLYQCLMLQCLYLSLWLPSPTVARSREYTTVTAATHHLSDITGHTKCVLASVDTAHGLANEMVKLHSLLGSTRRQGEIYFGFLVANAAEVGVMRKAIDQCHFNISYGIKVMETFPPFMQNIMRKDERKKIPVFAGSGASSWYHPGVFGNFLLPEAFPECDYFVYLDNDMFMNIDIVSEVFERVSLTRKERKTGRVVSTHVGFLFESCEQSSRIRHGQFNNSHHYVKEKGIRRIPPYKYINNGIWLVNATTWRAKNVTADLWDTVLLAQTEPIFLHSNGKVNRRPDDQHVNFLVQGARAAHLPPHLNMRKNCERKAQSFHHRGILHLAGGRKNCPVAFPSKPMALMTSVVHSLSRQCDFSPRLQEDCRHTQQLLLARNITFHDEGLGSFHFPPLGAVTRLSRPVVT